MTASSTSSAPRIRVNPLVARLCHWVNALAIFIMVGSGWRIYNSDPIVPGLIPYFNHHYTLGGDFELSFKLHGEPGLAGATLWHFAGMWLLVINFLVYVAYGLVSGRFRRKLLPLRPREILPQPGQHVTQLRDVGLPGEQHVGRVNVVNFAGPRVGDRNLVARIIERILHPEVLVVEHRRVHLMPPSGDSASR